MKSPETTVTFLLCNRCIIEVRLVNRFLACSAPQSRVILYESLSINPHEKPIEIAVSFLSPVSIQTLIFDFLSSVIVYFTQFCSLSSIAVAATSLRPFSIYD